VFARKGLGVCRDGLRVRNRNCRWSKKFEGRSAKTAPSQQPILVGDSVEGEAEVGILPGSVWGRVAHTFKVWPSAGRFDSMQSHLDDRYSLWRDCQKLSRYQRLCAADSSASSSAWMFFF